MVKFLIFLMNFKMVSHEFAIIQVCNLLYIGSFS